MSRILKSVSKLTFANLGCCLQWVNMIKWKTKKYYFLKQVILMQI